MRTYPTICPVCGRQHRYNTRLCASCRRAQRSNRPPPAPSLCAPGLCNAIATQQRHVLGGWLHLCDRCAALYDELESQPILADIPTPSQAIARGFCIA